MKTFRELIPGDFFFIINMMETPEARRSDSYTPSVLEYYPSNISTHIIESIGIGNPQNKTIEILDKYKKIIELKENQLDLEIIHIHGFDRYKRHTWEVVVSNKERLEEAKREVALILLNEEDDKLERFKEQIEFNKRKIRIAYWDDLNK